ncbi:MAG: inositol monophosphatase [Bacteroidales bacterium]|nr:inositol monophosphatase [Bacteroidales bacterium]
MELEKICKHAIKVIRETGNFIRQENLKLNHQQVESKGLHDYVTYVDKTSEKRLTEGLKRILPKSGFITEEDTMDNHEAEYTWIIDPLDGTTNYIHGIPVYSVSVALQRNKQTVVGVVYEIVRDECFYSWEGAPAYMNGQPVRVTVTSTLNNSLLATGFPYYDYSRMPVYLQLFEHLLRNTRGVRRLGSAAVDLAYVACGRFDAFFEYSLHAWDVAAGAFLVKQAGGVVCDFSGKDQYIFGKEIIATNHSIHKVFMDTFQKYFKEA